MTAWTDPPSVLAILAPFTTPTAGNAAGLSDEQLQAACNDATSEVQAWVSQKYDVLLAATPLLKRLTTDVAAYRAQLTTQINSDLSPNSAVVLRYADAVAMLKLLNNGTLAIDDGSSNQTDAPTSTEIAVGGTQTPGIPAHLVGIGPYWDPFSEIRGPWGGFFGDGY